MMKLFPKIITGPLHAQNKGSCDWYVLEYKYLNENCPFYISSSPCRLHRYRAKSARQQFIYMFFNDRTF